MKKSPEMAHLKNNQALLWKILGLTNPQSQSLWARIPFLLGQKQPKKDSILFKNEQQILDFRFLNTEGGGQQDDEGSAIAAPARLSSNWKWTDKKQVISLTKIGIRIWSGPIVIF